MFAVFVMHSASVLQGCTRSMKLFNFSCLNRFHDLYIARFSTHVTRQVYYPKCAPVKTEDVQKLSEFILRSNNLLVISGAGLSTESGIPDYRSKDVGLYDRVKHRPMKHQDFMRSSSGRQRYWARNYIGWKKFMSSVPNAAHRKLYELEEKGKSHWHVTQNVDGLNKKVGIQNLTELHGSMFRVVCLSCKEVHSREMLQAQFEELNKNWSATIDGFGPDADVFLDETDALKFTVPTCEKCGGILKPDVTFFGDNVPLSTVEFINDKVDESDGILVVGSSLQVWSGYKFILRASKNGIPLVAINVGPTRADSILNFKIDALCTDVLSQIDII